MRDAISLEPKAAFEASLVRRDELAKFAPVDGASLARDLYHGLGEPAAALGILLCFARGGGSGRQPGCLGHRRGLARVVLAPRLEQGTELLAHRIATLDALPASAGVGHPEPHERLAHEPRPVLEP